MADAASILTCNASEDAMHPSADRPVASEIFPSLMDIAEAMLQNGADVHTVEQLLVKLGQAYGATRMNVLVITAEIIVTVTFSGNYELTFSRRIVGEGDTNFEKLEALNSICNDCLENPLSAEELDERLVKVKRMRVSDISLYLGGACASGGFAMFFGGDVLDGLTSAVFALIVCFAIKHFKPLTPNTIVFNFATALVAGLMICASGATQAINVNVVIIGVIMLLIPGLAMTNSTRDMLSGDTISGVMRFVESLLWATALALGFMSAIWVATEAGLAFNIGDGTVKWDLWQLIPLVTVAALGFALFFNVRPKHVPIATLGGLLTWLLFYILQQFLSNVTIFLPCIIASAFAAVYSEVFAKALKVPSAIFFIIAVIPLIPGRALYFTMYNAVSGDASACASYALMTLMYAAGIAAGICIIAAIVQTWELWSDRHKKAAKAIVNAEKTVIRTGKKALDKVGISRTHGKESGKPSAPDDTDSPGK